MIDPVWFVLAIASVGIISVMWPLTVGSGWAPTPLNVVRRMLEMAEVGPSDIVYDLGSGDGRVVVEAVKRHQARAVGIEADPLRVLWSRFVIALFQLRDRGRIVWGNLFHRNLSEATVVTLYLMPRANQRLKPKLHSELKPGTRVVSHVWTFDNWVAVKTDKKSEAYLYIIGQSDKTDSS